MSTTRDVKSSDLDRIFAVKDVLIVEDIVIPVIYALSKVREIHGPARAEIAGDLYAAGYRLVARSGRAVGVRWRRFRTIRSRLRYRLRPRYRHLPYVGKVWCCWTVRQKCRIGVAGATYPAYS